MKSQKRVLFDLGNVLYPIDLSLTYQAFAQLSSSYSAQEIQSITEQEGLWLPYEQGLEEDAEFRQRLRHRLDLQGSDADFDQAFNALLLGFHPQASALLEGIRPHFSGLYLLSNTSHIHSKVFGKKLGQAHPFDHLEDLYLSFEIKEIKPQAAVYQYVCAAMQVAPEEVLFFDDNAQNIAGAQAQGLQAIFIHTPSEALKIIQQTLLNYADFQPIV